MSKVYVKYTKSSSRPKIEGKEDTKNSPSLNKSPSNKKMKPNKEKETLPLNNLVQDQKLQK